MDLPFPIHISSQEGEQSSERSQDDPFICPKCRTIDLANVIKEQDSVHNEEVWGTWKVADLILEQVQMQAGQCSLCSLWLRSIIGDYQHEAGLGKGSSSVVDLQDSDLALQNSDLELRAFNPRRHNTCWNLNFARHGVLEDAVPETIIFVCYKNTQPYSPTASARERSGNLISMWRENNKESMKLLSNNEASFEDSMEKLKQWWGDYPEELSAWSNTDNSTSQRAKRLVDCETFRVVEAKPGMKYVCLSYAWKTNTEVTPIPGVQPSNSLQTSLEVSSNREESAKFFSTPDVDGSDGRPLPSMISQAVMDAMLATKTLGYRYLWVDKYCINQGDMDELTTQIYSMDLIYGFGQITLVVATSQGTIRVPGYSQQAPLSTLGVTLLGIPEPSPEEIDASTWNSRAWTMQEDVNSRRVVFFTDNGLYYRGVYHIWDGRWKTGLDSRSSSNHYEWAWTQLDDEINTVGLWFRREHAAGWVINIDNSGLDNHPDKSEVYVRYCWELARLWNRLATEYTRRLLTNETDVNYGFFGVTETLRTNMGYCFTSFECIPFCRKWKYQEIPGVREKIFLLGLLWALKFPKKSRRRQPAVYFPSWSWVGWIGPVIWLQDEDISAEEYGNRFLVHCSIRLNDYNFEELDDDDELWLSSSNSITALYLQAYHIDHQSLQRDGTNNWSISFLSISQESDDESWSYLERDHIGSSNAHLLQGIWKDVEEERLVCLFVGEFIDDGRTQAFCLLLRPLSLSKFERIGMMVLERRFNTDERFTSFLAGLVYPEQKSYRIV